MPWFTKPAWSGHVLRTRLRLESLDGRTVPSSLAGENPDPSLYTAVDVAGPATGAAPVITGFDAQAAGSGWYLFTGQVELVDGSAAGLTIRLGGISSLEGRTVVTQADGSFSLLVGVRTDGSDYGTATAETTANGQGSNLAMCNVDPAPPTP